MELPESWSVHSVGRVAEVRLGKTPRRSDYRGSGPVKMVRFRDLKAGFIEWTEDNKAFVGAEPEAQRGLRDLQVGDTLITASAHSPEHIGKKLAFVSGLPSKYERICYVGELLGVRSAMPDQMIAKWPFYYFQSKMGQEQIAERVRGGHLTNGRARDMKIVLPPITEQRKIAAILGSVDEAIERTQAVIDQVEVVKKGLMQQLLTRGMPGRHTRFKQTEIGEIPESWRPSRLGDLADVSSGGTPKRSEPSYWNGRIFWVKTGEVKYEPITGTKESITREGLEGSSARLLPPGTILMAMYGQGLTRGRVGWLEVEAATNQACAAIQPHDGVNPRFVYQALVAAYPEIRKLGREGSQKNLNLSLVKGIPLPRPSGDEQESIARLADQLDERVRLETTAIRALQPLKQALMSVLLTGELRVTPEPT